MPGYSEQWGHNVHKLKVHLWTLGRWFGLPFFGATTLIGVILAGGSLSDINTWLAFAATALIMAGGHSFNTFLDSEWTKLDVIESHSVEKAYTAGSVVITEGWASARAVLINGIAWYVLGCVPTVVLGLRSTPLVWIPVGYGMLVTVLYSISKFSFFHEAVLASGVSAGAVLGAFSVGSGDWVRPVLVSIPIVMIFSYAGLALDEWPDAPANLSVGVKSLAFKVYEYEYDLATYVMLWVISAFLVQLLFIEVGWLKPLTGLTLVILPPAIAISVFLKKRFKPAAMALVAVAMLFPILVLVGQLLG